MPNALDKITDYIVAALLMFLLPVCIFGIKKDNIVQVNVEKKTSEFVELVAAHGYVTRDMYEKYLDGLGKTGKLYDVTLQHEQNVFEPEYILRTANEVIEEDESQWAGSNDYYDKGIVNEIPIIADPIDNSGLTMNFETNESILASSTTTPASAGHVHTEECYIGHRHTGELLFLHTHKHDGSCIKYTQIKSDEFNCNNCGAHYNRVMATWYWDNGVKLGMYVGGNVSCLVCGSSNITTVSSISGYGYSCGYDIDINSDGYNDEVGTGTAYTYKKSAPQDISVKVTYTSDCYTYINLLSFPVMFYDYYGKPFYDDDTLGQIALNGPESYTSIPQYYTFGVGDSATYREYYITYSAVLVNGQAELRFGGSNIPSSANPHFPSMISWQQADNLRRAYAFDDFVQKYSNWNTSRYYDSIPELTGNLNLSAGRTINSWYPTCGQIENGVLACNQKIISITPTHPVQSVYVGEPLITTVIATYQDGSTKVIVTTTTFLTTIPATNQTAALTIVDAAGKTSTCTITVNVIPKNKTCVNGHTYNLNNDGSDPGCPYCHGWLRSLSIANPSSGKLTLYRNVNNSLIVEGVSLLAVYLDGHIEYVYNGYVDNLDPDYIGLQNVKVGYKGQVTVLQVEIIRNRIQCRVCGLFYNLYLDDTDPGCPYCKARVPVFTGNVMNYCIASYGDEIITELYEGTGTYYFRRGDNFNVKAESKNKPGGLATLNRLFHLHIRASKSDKVKDEVTYK